MYPIYTDPGSLTIDACGKCDDFRRDSDHQDLLSDFKDSDCQCTPCYEDLCNDNSIGSGENGQNGQNGNGGIRNNPVAGGLMLGTVAG